MSVALSYFFRYTCRLNVTIFYSLFHETEPPSSGWRVSDTPLPYLHNLAEDDEAIVICSCEGGAGAAYFS